MVGFALWFEFEFKISTLLDSIIFLYSENPEIFDESPTQTTGRKAKAAANLRISQFVLMESERKSDGRDIRGFFRKIPVVMKMETCPKLPNMRALKRAMQSEDVSLVKVYL